MEHQKEYLVDNIQHLKCIIVDGQLQFECLWQHPVIDRNLQNMVFPFCFPEGSAIISNPGVVNYSLDYAKTESFAFILTNANGDRRYVYCRRFPNYKLPECICIIAERPFESLFKKILDKASELRTISITLLSKYLQDITKQYIPPINGSLTNISFHHIPYEISSSEDISKHHSFNARKLLQTFGSSLLVDLVGELINSIGVLSDTILALTSLIHPFQVIVQHQCPFLIGIKRSLLETVKKECDNNFSDTVVVDVDDGTVLSCPSSHSTFTSEDSIRLRSELSLILQDPEPDEDVESKNIAVYSIFHLFFYNIFHPYFSCFEANPKAKKKFVFSRDSFKEKLSEDDRYFFDAFEESQMCFMFFEERESQKSSEYQIEAICPFGVAPASLILPIVDCNLVLEDMLNSGESVSMICRYCNGTITGSDPCSRRGKELFHTKCFRCKKNMLTKGELDTIIHAKEKKKITKAEKIVQRTFRKKFDQESKGTTEEKQQ
ncbi:DENN domain-containing protein 2D [Entamoeba marina]